MPPTRPCKLPPFWLILLLGWAPVVLGNAIAAMTVLGHPGQMLQHAFFLLIYAPATVPLGLVQRAFWRRRVSWQRGVALLLPLSFVLAFASTSAGIWLMAHWGALPGGFRWIGVMGSMDIVWFVLLAFTAMSMMVGYYVSLQEEGRRALAATALARDAELRALRYQLHPHFLFNTLNAISTLVVEQRTDDATRMIARLGDFLRATLEGSGAHEVTLAEELALTEHYLDIEKARLGDRLTVTVRVGPDALSAAIPHLLLQPLVENAIRHGIAPRREGGRLEIAAERTQERLQLRLRNDGVAQNSARAPSGESAIGLNNVRERLQRLYEDDHHFALDIADDGNCEVVIDLPCRPLSDNPLRAPEHGA